MKVTRKISMSINLPVSVGLTVEADVDDLDDLEHAEWEITEVDESPIAHGFQPRDVQAAMDEADSEMLAKLASEVEDDEPRRRGGQKRVR